MYCIYKIENKIDGKFYIGKTKNFEKRKHRHFWELQNNKHHSQYLQRAFNKYGEENFKMYKIKDNLTDEEATDLEEKLINETYDDNYNVSKMSSGGDLLTYHPNHDEIVQRISKSIKERASNEEYRKRLSEKMKGENNPMYHKHHTEETKQKMRENNTRKGKKLSDEERKYLSECMKKAFAEKPEKHIAISNGLKKRYEKEENRKQTSESSKRNWQNPEYRKKMLEIAKEHGLKCRKYVYAEGKIYFGTTEAANAFNLSQPSVIHRVKSDNFPNWYYVDENGNPT